MKRARQWPFGSPRHRPFRCRADGRAARRPAVLGDTCGNYIGLYSIVALGLVLLTGVAGLTSFGQAAFVGLGAYTTAYLSLTRYGIFRRGSIWLVGLVMTLALALLQRPHHAADERPLPGAGHDRVGHCQHLCSCSAVSTSSAVTRASPAFRRLIFSASSCARSVIYYYLDLGRSPSRRCGRPRTICSTRGRAVRSVRYKRPCRDGRGVRRGHRHGSRSSCSSMPRCWRASLAGCMRICSVS